MIRVPKRLQQVQSFGLVTHLAPPARAHGNRTPTDRSSCNCCCLNQTPKPQLIFSHNFEPPQLFNCLDGILSSRFADLTGIDYSEGAIDLARNLADRDGFTFINFL
ncbi:hypothetical protein HHK36_014908 [Tetracentron sinense]|uniref:Uncharacterized protein n=1 Tax=Tetracentron sinense TaxID=13715 RepID=A0A834Z3M8_TETSI|nr:hypothetical protein HHK36_014908 [Tetracentron sinense]